MDKKSKNDYDTGSSLNSSTIIAYHTSPKNKLELGIREGESLFARGKLDQAKALFEGLSKDFPGDPEILNNLGVILSQLGDFEGAVQYLEESLKLDPQHPDALKNIRDLYELLSSQNRTTITSPPQENNITSQVHPILIVMEEGIGNMIMLTPAIRAIKEIRPDLPIHLLGNYPALEIPDRWELVDRVLTSPDDTFYDTVFYTIWSGQMHQKYDGHFQSHSSNIGEIDYKDASVHETGYHMNIAGYFGYSKPPPSPYCPVKKVEIDLPADKPIIGLADTYLNLSWRRKSWPHYRKLARTLIGKGYHVALLGGKDEADRFRRERWPEEVIDLQGKYSVAETAYLMTKCKAVVANDSGPAHMAAALDIPTYVLFGSTLVAKNSPRGKNVHVITSSLSCSPCQYTRAWTACKDGQCMQEITTGTVLNRLMKQSGNSHPRTAGVLIVGVLDNPASTNTFMRNAFQSIGIEVDEYNYRTRAASLGSYEALADDFQDFMRGKEYGLIIFSKVNGMDLSSLRYAGKHGKTWYWFMDNLGAAKAMDAGRYAAACDFASATSEEVTEFFLTANPASVQIIEGFDPVTLYKQETEREHDLVFIGNATEKRIREMEAIRKIVPVAVFGKGWPDEFHANPPVFNDTYREVVSKSRIILNLIHSNIFSDRVVHSMACGSFVLSQYCPDLEKHFQDGVHLSWFRNMEEFAERVSYYLDRTTERERIAQKGMEYVREKYPWSTVCRDISRLAGLASDASTEPTPDNIASKRGWKPEGQESPKGSTQKKVLLVSWHGLGDNVMLTPALKKYKEQNPDTRISLLGLKRFGKTLEELLSGLPFLDEVLPILPDAWNDFDNYRTGVNAALEKARRFAEEKGFDKLLFLPTSRKPGYRLHKIFRFAEELGVGFESLKELQTELAVTEEAEKKVDEFVRDVSKPILVLHAVAGNNPKTLPPEEVEQLLRQYDGYTIFEFGRKSASRSILVPEDDMEFSKALIKRADRVIAIDSVVMHIAGAFRRPCLAVFTVTPVHQAIPLTYEVDVTGEDNERTCIRQWPGFRKEILEKYVAPAGSTSVSSPPRFSRVLITGAGHSGTNWVTEIVRASGHFRFVERQSPVEDRDLFRDPVLPRCYGGKLATENIGFYWENLKRLLDDHDDLTLLFVTRHPVDNCLSKIVRGQPEGGDGIVRNVLEYSWDSTLKGSIKSMELMYSILLHLKKEYPERVIHIKLEELITDTRKIMEKVCRFLGIPLTPPMLEAHTKIRNPYQKRRYGNRIDPDQVALYNNWENAFDGFYRDKGALVAFLIRELYPIARGLGYETVDPFQKNRGTPFQDIAPSEREASPRRQPRPLPEHYYSPNCYWAHMLTFRCNGGCPFCILNGRGTCRKTDELTGREILDFWNGLEHPQGQRLSLIGGETTLHPDLAEIVNHLEGYAVTITTNCKGPFYEDPLFYKKFKPHPSSTLRINTTFHPHLISAEEYIGVIRRYRTTGYFVDQTSFVNRPDINRYREAIERVQEEIPIKAAPYLGFYDPENRFNAPFDASHIEPNERYQDQRAAAVMCGLTDMEAYRDICGQYEKRETLCDHPFRSLIIGPDGNYYHCHYKLYYGIDPVCHISGLQTVAQKPLACRHYGFCNWCDVPRVGCGKNPAAKKMILNKLYDRREAGRSEIQHLIGEIGAFAKSQQLEFNPLKWFEYAYALLYSGHRHSGRVLDVGSARSVFPYDLSARGYQVTMLDLADEDYRNMMGRRFNVHSVTGDLRKFQPELEGKFDLITNLSVIEHIDRDTDAVLQLAKYLRPGGVMVISTDFYERYIEYPEANRTIVHDRPAGSHTDSRVYTEETFLDRIIKPLERTGMERMGLTDFQNVDIRTPEERAVRGLYTFGVAILRRSLIQKPE